MYILHLIDSDYDLTAEKQYIRQLKSHSVVAFEALYNMYYSKLFAYCLQWTKSHEDAKEIVQDVFTKLWLNREQIKEENTLMFYIFKIAKNQLINRYRQNLQSPIFEEYVQYTNVLKISGNTTDAPIMYDDFCRKVEGIKRQLPVTQQKIFDSSIIDQKSNKEIAQELNLSEQTVRNQLSIALKKFRQQLVECAQSLSIFLF